MRNFCSGTPQNRQHEILAVASMAMLAIYLRQQGSWSRSRGASGVES
ncbi:DUF6766 family protein [Streptomyces chartreusis]